MSVSGIGVWEMFAASNQKWFDNNKIKIFQTNKNKVS